ncbi:PREDICTED: uncharacterized protein [Prunus dulcis]|uniref:PREDICTED: uncharacterized protein n=1 Tax=Prunus dulcis TaxID=3755 RepID=A0A5E4FSM2_PRUDU|nr:PREDICTED: uncharacterized protein [Prunus dulcis]
MVQSCWDLKGKLNSLMEAFNMKDNDETILSCYDGREKLLVIGDGWTKPTLGFRKLICDGAWSANRMVGAGGWVLKDDSGCFHLAGRVGG